MTVKPTPGAGEQSAVSKAPARLPGPVLAALRHWKPDHVSAHPETTSESSGARLHATIPDEGLHPTPQTTHGHLCALRDMQGHLGPPW